MNSLTDEEQLNSKTVFFFEATHGKFIRDALQRVGVQLMTHKNMGWLNNMLDTEIIAECGKKGWAIITGDKSIERVPEERQAVINAKCKVFMFDDSHATRVEDWAASLVVGRHRLIEIAERTDGPLFVTIKKCRVHGHLSQPRFVGLAGGGWRELQVKPVLEQPKEARVKKTRREQQERLRFTTESVALVRRTTTVLHCHLCAKLFEGS